jgi:hypothetical protein
MSKPSHIVYRNHTFLSAAAMGLSAVAIVVIVSCTATLLYAVHLAGEKSERVVSLAQDAVRGLPELVDSLPPALADMLDDRRQPDYCRQLAITARLTSVPGPDDGTRTAIEVVNNGDEVVSLLSLRITLVDEEGRILCEAQEWAATPLAAEHEWRGPIMPGSRRHFVGSYCRLPERHLADGIRPEVEITELRVWNSGGKRLTPPAELPETAISAAPLTDAGGNG